MKIKNTNMINLEMVRLSNFSSDNIKGTSQRVYFMGEIPSIFQIV